MSSYSSQLHEEQQAVSRAYHRLDAIREQTRQRLDAVRAAGSHGSPTQRTERDSFATLYEDRLTQLRAVEDRLVFGRIDNTQGERRYIGRIGLSSERHEPMLTDWRAEAARPFYEATPSHHGDIVMRRHITLNFRDVVSIEDEVLDMHSQQVDKASASGTLTGEGALLASLSSRRTSKMTDIVATIQAEQDRIIRAPLDRVIVVQGGPGTGKTAVALHRAAYLLYTHRRKLERSGVLVVGPSMAFLRYIDQVLPSLGETGVVSRTMADLIPGIEAPAFDNVHNAKLKGDKRMHSAIANAVAARERIPSTLPIVRINGINVAMVRTDVEQALSDAHRTHQQHNKARNTFVRSILSTMRNRYVEQLDYTPEQAELSDAMMQLRMNDDIRKTLNLAWLPMTGQWLIEQMFSKPEQLRRFAPWLEENDVVSLTRSKDSPLTRSDIPLLDEAMELLGPDPKTVARLAAAQSKRKQEEQYAQDTLAQAGIGNGLVTSRMLLEGIEGADGEALAQRAATDREWTYGHIVVDEAQELTAMDWRMLVRRCPSRSFTIVGDVAQTAALGGTRRWQRTMDAVFGAERWDLDELTINYRNPLEVSNRASDFAKREGLYISTLKAVRALPQSVNDITVERPSELETAVCEQVLELTRDFIAADGTGRIAIITPHSRIGSMRLAIRHHLGRHLDPPQFKKLDSQRSWDKQVMVCDTQMVKGLEYDAVIVVQPGEIESEAPSRIVAASDLYVAMTRPTQRLFVVRTRDDAQQLSV